MSTTIYATFLQTDLAERAAGALLDYGVRPEDISIVRKHVEAETHSEQLEVDRPVGVTGTTDAAPGTSAAAYGASPASATDRFGADATGLHEGSGLHGRSDANGIAAEHQVKRALGVAPDSSAPTAARADDQQYDNLASYDYDDSAEDAPSDPERAAKAGITPTTAADAGAGAVKGAGIGLGVGALAALASIFIPGVGLVVGGGALALALGGAAASAGAGAVAGAVTGYLKDQGVDEHVAQQYEAAIGEGGALMAVSVPSANVDEQTVRSILDKYGAANVGNFQGRGYIA